MNRLRNIPHGIHTSLGQMILPLGMGKWCFGRKTFDLTGLKLEFPNFNSQNPLLLLFFFFYVGMEGQVC